jgi:hypothetical protein
LIIIWILCHLGLNKDSPETREVQLPDKGVVVEIPKKDRHSRWIAPDIRGKNLAVEIAEN